MYLRVSPFQIGLLPRFSPGLLDSRFQRHARLPRARLVGNGSDAQQAFRLGSQFWGYVFNDLPCVFQRLAKTFTPLQDEPGAKRFERIVGATILSQVGEGPQIPAVGLLHLLVKQLVKPADV